MKKPLSIILLSLMLPAILTVPAAAQSLPDRTLNCAESFEELTGMVEENYIGYRELVLAGADATYRKLKADYRNLLKDVAAEDCTGMYQGFLKQFNDGHLFVFERPVYTEAEKELLLQHAREQGLDAGYILERLDDRPEDRITGKWSDGNYEIGIIGDGNRYRAYTLSASDSLPAGSLLAELRPAGEGFSGTIYDYNHEPKYTEANIYKEGTLLKFFGQTVWGRLEDGPEREINIINPDDITQPSITFLDSETTLFTIPSFSSDPYFLRDLILENADSVAAREKLIIDVRGNTGGNAVYFMFTDIYASREKPESAPGKVLASEATLTYFQRLAERTPDIYRPVVDRITGNMGEIVEGPTYPARAFNPYPSEIERVAILTDEACMSACESFILHSKAMSDKVEVFGTATGGMIDYTSVYVLPIESGNQNIFFGFPTSTLGDSYYTSEYPNGFNERGILPDHPIAKDVRDKVAYVAEQLKSGSKTDH